VVILCGLGLTVIKNINKTMPALGVGLALVVAAVWLALKVRDRRKRVNEKRP